jgi:hypothetical protein
MSTAVNPKFKLSLHMNTTTGGHAIYRDDTLALRFRKK